MNIILLIQKVINEKLVCDLIRGLYNQKVVMKMLSQLTRLKDNFGRLMFGIGSVKDICAEV